MVFLKRLWKIKGSIRTFKMIGVFCKPSRVFFVINLKFIDFVTSMVELSFIMIHK